MFIQGNFAVGKFTGCMFEELTTEVLYGEASFMPSAGGDLENALMYFIGGAGTGTIFHVDWTEALNYAIELVSSFIYLCVV